MTGTGLVRPGLLALLPEREVESQRVVVETLRRPRIAWDRLLADHRSRHQRTALTRALLRAQPQQVGLRGAKRTADATLTPDVDAFASTAGCPCPVCRVELLHAADSCRRTARRTRSRACDAGSPCRPAGRRPRNRGCGIETARRLVAEPARFATSGGASSASHEARPPRSTSGIFRQQGRQLLRCRAVHQLGRGATPHNRAAQIHELLQQR